MGKRFLVDTNVLIEFIGNLLPGESYSFVSEVIDNEFNISVINKIEILSHRSVGKEIEEFIALANVYELSDSVVEKTIEIRKLYKSKLPDAVIAATAIVNKLDLLTRNMKDFEKIKGLNVRSPYEMK